MSFGKMLSTMANFVETWKYPGDNVYLYHFTKTGNVIRSDGKVLYITDTGVLNFSGMGQRATVADFKRKFNDMRGWIQK